MTDTLVRPPQPAAAPEQGSNADWVRLGIIVALVVLLGVTTNWYYPLVILGIIVMIFFHELGHYATAKWSGMKVTEFFFGFGPRLWSFRRGETDYGIKPFLAGAYVRIVGMSTLEEVDPADEPRTYRNQPFRKRLLVVCAGSAMHMIMAFVLLVIVLMAGIPGGSVFLDQEKADELLDASPQWSVSTVFEGSGADRAGVEVGDKVVSLAGVEIESWSDIGPVLVGKADETVPIIVERDGARVELIAQLEPRESNPDVGFLGIGPERELADISRGPIDAVGGAFIEVGRGLELATGSLVGFFSADGLGDYAGQVREGSEEAGSTATTLHPSATRPDDNSDENRLLSILGAVRLGVGAAESGWVTLIQFFIVINVFIGLINMVPLLPFDGGHAAVAIYERIRSRRGREYRVDMTRLLPLTYGVVMLLGLIFVTSVYLDIVKPIG